jgi:phospholipase/carboxylesterase
MQPFEPALWLRGRHAQTVFGPLFRPPPRVPVRGERWELSDGDFLDVDRVEGDRNAPLLVVLHGAGADAANLVGLFTDAAEAQGFLILAPDSRGRTWDVILGEYGPDVAFLDRALEQVFRSHPVAPERIAVSGFSDGASYALSLGIINGTLFSDILAFSPGFAAPTSEAGKPRIFVSHGTEDSVLPIDRCSRRLVPMLRRAGYDVDYREFAGGHTVPPDMVAAGLARFLG